MKQFLDSEVSYFKNKLDTHPCETPTLRNLILGGRFKAQIERLRDTADPDERRRLKGDLPCFTPTGTFRTRNSAGLIQPSGLIAVDLDAKDNKHVDQQLWQNLSQAFDPQRHPAVLYCGRSCSGTGWWLLVPVEDYDPKRHKLYFAAITADLAEIGLTADRSGSDIARLRFVSYDPQPYLNENAQPYRLPVSSTTREEVKGGGLVEDDSAAWAAFQVARYLYVIDNHEADITEGYENWRNIAFALLSIFAPEHARELFHRLSCYHPKYSPDACERQFDACLISQRRGGHGVGIGTLLRLLREKCGALLDFENLNDERL